MSTVIDKTGFVPDLWQDSPLHTYEGLSGASALLLTADMDPEQIGPHLEQLSLIVIPFGSSTDGRGFSLARTLREMGFSGHLRARGHILVDQARAAFRCGFDDIEIEDPQAARNPEAQWRAVSHRFDYRTDLLAG